MKLYTVAVYTLRRIIQIKTFSREIINSTGWVYPFCGLTDSLVCISSYWKFLIEHKYMYFDLLNMLCRKAI